MNANTTPPTPATPAPPVTDDAIEGADSMWMPLS